MTSPDDSSDKPNYPTYRWFANGGHHDVESTPEEDELDRQWVESGKLAASALEASGIAEIIEEESTREPFAEGSTTEELVDDLVAEYHHVNAAQVEHGGRPRISIDQLAVRMSARRKIPGSVFDAVLEQARTVLMQHPPVAPESGLARWAQGLDDPDDDARSRQFKD